MQTGAEDQQVTTGAESMEEEFMWEEFLEETGATAAPHTIFRHVEVSLQSSFQPGMKLEVASKSSPESYWVATIITTCGQLLLLRYSGYGDDRKADFWCDVMTAELHPVGWCAQNHKTLTPPEENFYLRTAIREKYSDWTEFLVQDLTGSRTAPANLLEGPLRGKNTMDLIVADSVLELQNLSDPLLYWPVRVVQNVGGRLRLRPVGLSERHRAQDTWLFYLDVRLRPLGWALENRLTLEPPAELRPLLSDLDWQQALRDAAGQKDALALEVFKDQADLPRHAFRTGMKLEMVSPWEQLLIRPVSVTKVYSDTHFQVTLDDLRADATPRSAVCHANSPGILPVQWCLKNGVALERPRGYECPDFDWADYLKQSGSEAAPDACFPDTGNTRGFAEGMWLEAVNPARPEEVCVARVGRVRGRLLWLRLEGVPQSECIVDVESMDIFPVGWCEANAYPLTPPLRPVCQKQKKIAVVQPEKQRGERPLLLLPGFREPPLLLGAVPEQGPHRGAAARRGAREMLAGAEGAAQHADQRRLQAGPRPEGAAAATGARLGQPGGNAESQVQGENVSLHRPHRAPGRADPRFLQEGLREAAVLPQPVGPRPDGRQMPRELLCPDQDQIHILLRQEEAAPQSVGRRRGQAGTSAEEEEGHLRPEEETLVELGLYRCRISSG